MDTVSIFDEAAKFTDNVMNHYNSLELACAAHADVKKKTEAYAFHAVDWRTFKNEPLHGAVVLEQLAANIKDEEIALTAAKEALEEVLGRMHQGEQALWWESCERLFSSVAPLAQYEPVIVVPVIEKPVDEEALERDNMSETEEKEETREEIKDTADKQEENRLEKGKHEDEVVEAATELDTVENE